MRRRRQISMSNELHLVARAIDGTRILTEKWKDGHFNKEELPRLAHALHATLVLVRERLVLVDCAIRDTLDPRYLFHSENEAFDPLPGDDEGDVVLRSWSAKKAAVKLKQEAERAAHHLEVLANRRKRREEDKQ